MSQSLNHVNNDNIMNGNKNHKNDNNNDDSNDIEKSTPNKPESDSNNNDNDDNDNNDNDEDCNENEELKIDSNGFIKSNGHNDDDDNDNDNDDNNDSNEFNLSRSDKLDVGLLQHHEIEDFTMDEDKIITNCQPVTWSNCDATTFSVRRGPNYVSGQKSPSKKALYTVFAVDAYKLDEKIHKIWKYMNIDKYIEQYSTPYDRDTFPLPPLFILNVMVPNYPPEFMGTKCDGEGYQMILYAHLSQEIRDLLNKNKISNNNDDNNLLPSIRLLRDFIHSDLVNSEIRNRFKCIARIMNPNHTDFGFLANRLVKRYNGKPFLARTSSTFYHESGRYFAGDIDVHIFGYPARQGLSYVKDTIQTAIYDVGVVIEGHTNDQLPEQILACCRVSKLGVDLARPFPEKYIKLFKKERKYIKKLQQQIENKEDIDYDDDDDDDDEDDNDDDIINQQKQIYPKSQSNLLNGKGHRNGDVASKSTTSLPSISSPQTGNKQKPQTSSWGWGYFG